MPIKKNVSKKTSPASKSSTNPKTTTKKDASTTKKRATATKKNSSTSTRKYGPMAQKEVKKEIDAMKKGTAVSGRSGKRVTSRKQAIAIGLSIARKKGAKVPKKP